MRTRMAIKIKINKGMKTIKKAMNKMKTSRVSSRTSKKNHKANKSQFLLSNPSAKSLHSKIYYQILHLWEALLTIS